MAKGKQVSTLSYAVRGRVLGRHLGQLGLVLAALLLAPVAASLIYGDYALTAAYAATSLLLAAICIPLARLHTPEPIQTNEAMAISAFAFVGAALVNTPPFMVAGLGGIDALFEAVSGVTTTGLSTLASVENRSPTFLFARAWAQWYGGLGIVVLSAALLAGHGAVFRLLLQPESEREDLAAATRAYSRRVLTVYCVLTGIGIVVLAALDVPLFDAVTHVFAAVSTGGFSSHDASIANLPGTAAYWLLLLGVAGGISLPLYFTASRRGWRTFLRDQELFAFGVALLLLAAVLAALLSQQSGLRGTEALYHGGLLAFSAHTTTGFSTLQIAELPPGILLLVLIAMVVGGSLGSTAGGLKLTRVLILLKLLRSLVTRTALSGRAVAPQWWGAHQLEGHEVERILLVILLFTVTILFSWLAFVLCGYDPLPALFDVVSATATVGLSAGIVTPELPAGLKLLLCLDMLAGRLEIVALLVLFYPWTWVGRRLRR